MEDIKDIEKLFHSSKNYMRKIISSIIKDQDLIDDIMQEVFVALLHNHSLNKKFTLSTSYIATIIKFICTKYRDKNKHCTFENIDFFNSLSINESCCPFDLIILHNFSKYINAEIDKLNYYEKTLIIERFYHNKKYTDIARENNTKAYKVRNDVKKTLKKLSHKIQDDYEYYEELKEIF